jgi:hypothetical protein
MRGGRVRGLEVRDDQAHLSIENPPAALME